MYVHVNYYFIKRPLSMKNLASFCIACKMKLIFITKISLIYYNIIKVEFDMYRWPQKMDCDKSEFITVLQFTVNYNQWVLKEQGRWINTRCVSLGQFYTHVCQWSSTLYIFNYSWLKYIWFAYSAVYVR